MGDPYIIVRGGVVENDPALPVLDLDVLESEVWDDQTAEEVQALLARAREAGAIGVVVACNGWLRKYVVERSARIASVRAPQYEEEWSDED